MCWVKIQERNNAEIFKIDHFSYFWVKFPGGSPVLYWLVILLRSSLVVQIYCILLYYCIFFIRIFFSRFTAIFWSKVFSYTLLGWVTMSNNHIYWVSSTYFFLLFSYKYLYWETRLVNIWLYIIRICFVLIMYKQLF